MSEIKKYLDVKQLRQATRTGSFTDQTAGQAPHHLQGNVVILPKIYAQDFLLYCLNNVKPCPLIGLSSPGDIHLPELGDIDIRTDVPRYRVFKNGAFDQEIEDIRSVWTDDMVTFVLGCSFTFEEALIDNGYPVRHIEQGSNVPMFVTNIPTMPGGIFSGPLVVTMRSYRKEQIPYVFEISSQFPHAHGTPIYWGDPSKIGIDDLQKPDYGDAVAVPEDEIPVFWACGVTPQAALAMARPTISITHAPGCMLVTDWTSVEAPKIHPSLISFEQSEMKPRQHPIDAAQL